MKSVQFKAPSGESSHRLLKSCIRMQMHTSFRDFSDVTVSTDQHAASPSSSKEFDWEAKKVLP